MSLAQLGSDTWLILIAIISYFLGVFPTAFIVARRIGGRDIRLVGSGNIGAMNTYRLIAEEKTQKLAITGFILVLLGDIGKAVLAVFIARWLAFLDYNPESGLIVSSLFVVLGHNYSVLFKFRQGGRGIACLAGVLVALELVMFAVWFAVLIFSIFMGQYLLVDRKTHMRGVWFDVIGTQIPGRVVGMGIALVPLYFVNPNLFLAALAPIILVLIKHIERIRAYVRESTELSGNPDRVRR